MNNKYFKSMFVVIVFLTIFITNPISGSGDSFDAVLLSRGVYYYVTSNVLKDEYASGEKVTAVILIKNMGDEPDRDAKLTYYLVTPNGTIFGKRIELFNEVPPFYYDKEKCLYAGGTFNKTSGQCITILKRSVLLPFGAELGEWRFKITYETEVQPKVEVLDTFMVVKQTLALILLIITVLILFVLTTRRSNKIKALPKR